MRNSIILLIMALLVRTGYALFFVDLEYLTVEDQALYLQMAQQLKEVGLLGLDTERVPGYPLFLATIARLLGESLWAVIAVQGLVDSLSCVMIAKLAQNLFGRGFWIAGIISALNMNMVILSASILSDTLFLFLFILFLYSLVNYLTRERLIWLFFSVLLLSLATMVRPLSYYLLPFLFVALFGWQLWRRQSVITIAQNLLLYLLVVAAIFGGIHQRNYQQHGSVSLVSQTGAHLLGWVVPATYQYAGMGSYQEGVKLARNQLSESLQHDGLAGLPKNPFEISDYRAIVAKETLEEFGFIALLKAWSVGSAINLVAPSLAYAPTVRSMDHPSFYETKGNGAVEKLRNYVSQSGKLYLSILVVGTLSSAFFLLFAILGGWRLLNSIRKSNNPPLSLPLLVLLLLFIGYFLAITGPIIGVKYILPIEPLLTLLLVGFFIVDRPLSRNHNG